MTFRKYTYRHKTSDVGAVMARRYIPGEDLSQVNIAKHVTPAQGDMVGYNVHGGSEAELYFFPAAFFRKDYGEPVE